MYLDFKVVIGVHLEGLNYFKVVEDCLAPGVLLKTFYNDGEPAPHLGEEREERERERGEREEREREREREERERESKVSIHTHGHTYHDFMLCF